MNAHARFTHMEDGTAEDWAIIAKDFAQYAAHLPDRILSHLRLLDRFADALPRGRKDAGGRVLCDLDKGHDPDLERHEEVPLSPVGGARRRRQVVCPPTITCLRRQLFRCLPDPWSASAASVLRRGQCVRRQELRLVPEPCSRYRAAHGDRQAE